jgi:anaerobic magnesium-protoporphyrin IX monomethyl ester cyclase
MAKILLINPNKWGRGITSIWIPAHTALLRSRGHQVQLFDCTFFKNWTVDETAFNTSNEQYKKTDYHQFIKYSDEDVTKSLQKMVDTFQPDIIFWSALSSHIHGEGEYVNVQYGYELVSQVNTKALLITAGLQITARPEEGFARFPKTNYFIAGESEFVLADIADALNSPEKIIGLKGVVWKKGEKAVVNPPQPIISNLDSIPQYDYSVFDSSVFWRPYNGEVVKAVDFELSRGCIYTCSYCVETVIQRYYGFDQSSSKSGALTEPKKYLRAKSGKRVYEELKMLNSELGITLVRCQDTNFLTINRATLKELADLLDAEPLNIKLYVETRVDRISPSDVELLKRLRVDGVGTGIELSSEAFRTDFLNRFASTDKLEENVALLKKAGIKCTAYNIIGLPKENEEMILDTIRLNRRIQPDNITVAFYSPYIGTQQAERGVSEKYFDDYEYHVDGQLRTVSHSSLLDAKTLNFYKKYFNRFVRQGLDDLAALKKQEGLVS